MDHGGFVWGVREVEVCCSARTLTHPNTIGKGTGLPIIRINSPHPCSLSFDNIIQRLSPRPVPLKLNVKLAAREGCIDMLGDDSQDGCLSMLIHNSLPGFTLYSMHRQSMERIEFILTFLSISSMSWTRIPMCLEIYATSKTTFHVPE